jgi:hypothetical protein
MFEPNVVELCATQVFFIFEEIWVACSSTISAAFTGFISTDFDLGEPSASPTTDPAANSFADRAWESLISSYLGQWWARHLLKSSD